MIRQIIQEVMMKYISQNIIKESLTSTVYHFCDLKGLWGICRDNMFFLTSSNTNQSDKRMSRRGKYIYPFYMCFSRTKSSQLGYAFQRMNSSKTWQSCLVRFEIDGDKLNHLYKAHPVNYFIDDDDDKIHLYTKGTNPNVDYKQIARQQMMEYEDRLLSVKPFIKNASQYIKRVDVLIKPQALMDGRSASIIATLGYMLQNSQYINPNIITLYANEDAFNRMDSKQCISKDIILKKYRQDKVQNDKLTPILLNVIATSINLVCFGETDNDNIKSYLLQKYGFGEYVQQILEACQQPSNQVNIDNIATRKANMERFKPNFKQQGNWKFVVFMDEMFNNFTQILNINYNEIPTYKKCQWKLINNIPLRKNELPYKDKCLKNMQQNNFNVFCKQTTTFNNITQK